MVSTVEIAQIDLKGTWERLGNGDPVCTAFYVLFLPASESQFRRSNGEAGSKEGKGAKIVTTRLSRVPDLASSGWQPFAPNSDPPATSQSVESGSGFQAPPDCAEQTQQSNLAYLEGEVLNLAPPCTFFLKQFMDLEAAIPTYAPYLQLIGPSYIDLEPKRKHETILVKFKLCDRPEKHASTNLRK